MYKALPDVINVLIFTEKASKNIILTEYYIAESFSLLLVLFKITAKFKFKGVGFFSSIVYIFL